MKLLIGVPSPRDIPEVMVNWDKWKYDTVIVKMMPQLEAYTKLRNYFINRPDYTHFCIIPDDLVVPTEQLTDLWRMVQDKNYPILSGYCNLDETMPDTTNLQYQVSDTRGPPAGKGSWLEEEDLPDTDVFEIQFSGFPCMIIRRDVLTRVSWVGADGTNRGNFDWRFCNDVKRLGYPVTVARDFKFYHMRTAQYDKVKEWKKTAKEEDGWVEFKQHE